METKKIGVARNLEGRRDKQVEQRGFLGSKTTLDNTVLLSTHHYTFFQTRNMYRTKSEENPHVNYRL